MAYTKDTLISRHGYSGFGTWTDTIGDIGKGALNFFGAQQRAAGAQEALTQTNRDLIAAQQAQADSGPSTTTLLIGAAAIGGLAYLLLRKKKA
jgi:LPXTG-motif cell wall-anchored protein